MRRGTVTVLAVLGVVAALALGLAVAGLASSDGVSGAFASTNESTTESTTESPTPTRHKSALSAKSEVPKPKGVPAGAGGTLTLSIVKDHGPYVATFKLTYKQLTGKVVAAHIHKGKPGKTGPVLVALCSPCKNGATGKRTISTAVKAAIGAGGTYVNVHTAKNPAGEIRGQVK